ncbi:GNAT family N-acetyltransferase [Lentilactobacillus sp. SPB1-3]|uniref:GNAT family N-acetyltransferase n=1 Tax=Lentilactobacillus terminaliae TaxID=3003483 RepID=A0ACD5DF78_9LACO|nr:GNAT family N-acetyltransferase [Lentilactobacillus sp. SPB1-3]MCZ0976584.1 GNAT family N-acetyltransferase [Lentilactobacillus sp. SPB1-3]
MKLTYIREANRDDVSAIMDIINSAKAFLKGYGSPQWQDGHPNEQMINDDIDSGNGQVLIVDDKVAGYAAVSFTPDNNYKVITDGAWQKPDDKYAVIHRMAISADYRGQHLSNYMLSNLISMIVSQQVRNVRIDTHRVNKPLQGLVTSFGFIRRGQINVVDKIDPVREAFELNL